MHRFSFQPLRIGRSTTLACSRELARAKAATGLGHGGYHHLDGPVVIEAAALARWASDRRRLQARSTALTPAVAGE